MVIETKANVGDTVWFIYDSKVYTDYIKRIEITVDTGGTAVMYILDHPTISITLNRREEHIGLTKEELLKSL